MWTRPLATVATVLVIAAGASTPAFAAPANGSPALVAGTGTAGASGDGGPASQATLNHPQGVAATANGTVYIADTGNHKVRAVAPDGTITTVAGNGEDGTRARPVAAGAKGTGVALGSPTSLAVGADGTLYIVDLAPARLYALATDGTIAVRAGAGIGRGTPDPPMGPLNAVAAAPDGTVYVGDHDHNRILAVTPDGVVSVAAGNGVLTANAAGGPATEVPVGAPNGLAVDAAGDLWISGGLLLRRLHAGRIATVTAPAAGTWSTDDKATWPPADPPLNNVQSVSAAADGVYAIDRQSRSVRRLGAGGVVTDVASAAEDTFGASGPIELAAGAAPNGPVYLVDNVNSRIYAVPVSATSDAPSESTETSKWPYVLGGVVLVALVAAGLLLARRRRAGSS